MVSKALKYKDLEQQALHTEKAALKKQKREKVVFVLPTLLAGGAERVLLTLMNGLDRERFAPELLVLNEKGSLRDWIAEDIPFHSLGNRRISRSLPVLLKTLNRLKPDVIVSTMAAMNYGVLLIKPLLKNKPRIIIREAVIPSSIAENQAAPWVVRSAYQNLYPKADLVISPAQCIIDEFDSYLKMPLQRHALLHNPVDIAKVRAEQVIQPEPDQNRLQTPRFVCAGRLHKQKGFDRLIQALVSIRDESWSLHIMGEGAERQNLEDLIVQNNLQDKVFLDGLVPRPWPQIGAADCFLLPSRWEGLPNVVLEALAAGTPVIAMREAGGVEEIANLAEPGAVSIVDKIEDMVMLMKQVKAKPTTVFRPSLLPEYFHLDQVIARFSALVEGRPVPAKFSSQKTLQERRRISRSSFGRRQSASSKAA